MIVLDASAAVFYLATQDEQARWVEQQLDAADSVVAPDIFDLEVLHALRRLSRIGAIPIERASHAVSLLRELPIARWQHLQLIPRIWELRTHMTAYDASYVALAESLNAELVTTDSRLARAHGHTAQINAFAG